MNVVVVVVVWPRLVPTRLSRGPQQHRPQPGFPNDVLYGPLYDGGVSEEAHYLLRTLPEVLQCLYLVSVPVYL